MTKNKYNNNEQDMALSLSEILKVQLFKTYLQPLKSACCLFNEALFPLIARYLQRQQIRFKVSAPLNLPNNKPKRVIFFGSDLEENRKTLPRFVISYLQELPHCQLFYRLCPVIETNQKDTNGDAIFMVEYGFQHPLSASEITNHLQDKTFYFIFSNRQHPALIIDPAPTLKNDCDLSKPISSIEKPQYSLDPTMASVLPPLLQIKLRLIDDPHTLAPIQALYFTKQGLQWLETLLQHLPGPLLAHLRWAGDRKHGILLLPENKTLSLFPFAMPLKRIKTNLFIPLGQSLRPQLTNQQLDTTLDLAHEKLTFLTQELRFDIAENDFSPLDKTIIAAAPVSTTLEFSNPDEPFDFIWQNFNMQESDNLSVAVPDKNAAPLTITSKKDNNNQNQISPGRDSNTPTEILKEYALLLRRQNDFLGAATCFSLAEKPLLAAECYRLAALTLEQQ